MEYAAAGTGGYPPSSYAQTKMLRRTPRPAARWVKQWIPQDLASASSGAKCSLFKWVREDVYRNLKDNLNGAEPEAQARKPEPATEILFLCSYENCGKTFVDVSALRKHAHVHGERQFVCQEPGCGKKFVDSSKLKRHNLTHTGQKDFICPHAGCGKAFSLDFNLRSHLRTHSVENYHICPFSACGKRFTSDYKLRCHVKAHERMGTPIAVQHVPPPEKPQSTTKHFTSASTKHSTPASAKPSTPASAKPYTPASAKPSTPATASSADRPYVCPYEGCGKAYIHSYKLNLHLKTQHPEHIQDEHSGRLAASAGDHTTNHYSYTDIGDPAPNPKRSKANPRHTARSSKIYNVKVSGGVVTDTGRPMSQWPGKDMYEDDSEETEDHGNDVGDGWRYVDQNADDEETEEDEN